jgi:hypothetical protein
VCRGLCWRLLQVVKLLLEFHAPVTDARDGDGNNLLHKVLGVVCVCVCVCGVFGGVVFVNRRV